MANGEKNSGNDTKEKKTIHNDTNSKPKKYIDLTLETVTKKTDKKPNKQPNPKQKQQTKQEENIARETNKKTIVTENKTQEDKKQGKPDNNIDNTISENNKKTSEPDKKINIEKNNTRDSDKNIKTSENLENTSETSENHAETSENHLTAAATAKPKRGSKRAMIQHEDKLQIVQYYEDGMDTDEIAKIYGISKPYVYRILNDPAMKEVRAAKREAVTNSVYEVMEAHAATIESITTKYLALANDDARIAKTSLGGLFTVFGIIIDKQLKLEELRLKREELELRREEAKKPVKNDTGLLADFLEVINVKNTLPNK